MNMLQGTLGVFLLGGCLFLTYLIIRGLKGGGVLKLFSSSRGPLLASAAIGTMVISLQLLTSTYIEGSEGFYSAMITYSVALLALLFVVNNSNDEDDSRDQFFIHCLYSTLILLFLSGVGLFFTGGEEGGQLVSLNRSEFTSAVFKSVTFGVWISTGLYVKELALLLLNNSSNPKT